jgi:hypothetical protein
MSPLPTDEQPPHYDERLHQAYHAAEYIFNGFILKVGHRHPEFDEWLTEQGYVHYAFMTPFNPRSRELPADVNRQRLGRLHELLRKRQRPFATAVGRDPAESWLPETGVFLFDPPSGEVHELARAFGQNAVVEGKVDGVPFLVWV